MILWGKFRRERCDNGYDKGRETPGLIASAGTDRRGVDRGRGAHPFNGFNHGPCGAAAAGLRPFN